MSLDLWPKQFWKPLKVCSLYLPECQLWSGLNHFLLLSKKFKILAKLFRLFFILLQHWEKWRPLFTFECEFLSQSLSLILPSPYALSHSLSLSPFISTIIMVMTAFKVEKSQRANTHPESFVSFQWYLGLSLFRLLNFTFEDHISKQAFAIKLARSEAGPTLKRQKSNLEFQLRYHQWNDEWLSRGDLSSEVQFGFLIQLFWVEILALRSLFRGQCSASKCWQSI